MKVEIINDESINVFLNKFYFNNIDFSNKIEIANIIKDLIGKIEKRYKLNLNGFYKIKVYPNKKIGVFLNILKIDDNEFSSGADFRIVVYPNERFFLETENYEELEKEIPKKYYDNKFYVDINNIDNLNTIIDMGNIIYGEDVKEIIQVAKNIK